MPVIRRAGPADAEGIARVNSEPVVMAQLLQMPFPNVERLRARLQEQNSAANNDLHLVAELDGVIVGAAGLMAASVQPRRRHAMGLGIGIASAAQGQGLGQALMASMLDWADRWAQVLRIELTVYTDNRRAIALYERFGFRIEGTLRAYALRDGAFADVHAMARLHPQPPVPAWPEA